MWREVTKRPSLPAKGEVFTENTIEIVGSSMWSGGSGRGSLAEVTVNHVDGSTTVTDRGAALAKTNWRTSDYKLP